jgi:hypothetical protein
MGFSILLPLGLDCALSEIHSPQGLAPSTALRAGRPCDRASPHLLPVSLALISGLILPKMGRGILRIDSAVENSFSAERLEKKYREKKNRPDSLLFEIPNFRPAPQSSIPSRLD